MTAIDPRDALAESLEQVLETMFFATVLGDVQPLSGGDGLAARLVFRGDPSGAFTVMVSPEAARSLTAAFLALDEDDVTPERAAEVVCELANMLCGSALGRLEPEKRFVLGHPEAVPAPPVAGVPERGSRRDVDIGGGTVAVLIEIEA